jgi:multidrug efflux pump subunit AcrA (membrane-fusion protein)
MYKTMLILRSAASAALIAGVALLSGCGPAPYSSTTTAEQTTITTPPPPVTTTITTTSDQDTTKR